MLSFSLYLSYWCVTSNSRLICRNSLTITSNAPRLHPPPTPHPHPHPSPRPRPPPTRTLTPTHTHHPPTTPTSHPHPHPIVPHPPSPPPRWIITLMAERSPRCTDTKQYHRSLWSHDILACEPIRRFYSKKASDADLWSLLGFKHEQAEQTIEVLLIWYTMMLMWRHWVNKEVRRWII